MDSSVLIINPSVKEGSDGVRLTNPIAESYKEKFPYMSLLVNIYVDVTVETSMQVAFKRTKSQKLIVLIDADEFEDSKIVCGWIKELWRQNEDLLIYGSSFLFLVLSHDENNHEFMQDCLNSGATNYLLKPLNDSIIKMLWLSRNTLPDDCLGRATKISRILDHSYSEISSLKKFPELTKSRKDYIAKCVSNWGFDAFEFSADDLVWAAFYMITDFDFDDISISSEVLKRFLLMVRENYYDNPYHNFKHAVDVLQATFFFLKNIKNHSFSPLYTLALLVAAYCHDIGHPGFNNVFLVNANTTFAILYNDKSVMENYHSMVVFSILLNKDYNFVSTLSQSQFKQFRSVVIESIIATDMACHSEYVDRISNYNEHPNTSDHSLKCAALMKSADICNVIRPFKIAEKWALALTDEFLRQGDTEKRLGLPVSSINDREETNIPNNQVYFISNWAQPMYQQVLQMFPDLEFAMEFLEQNLFEWKARKSSESFSESHNTPRRRSLTDLLQEASVKVHKQESVYCPPSPLKKDSLKEK